MCKHLSHGRILAESRLAAVHDNEYEIQVLESKVPIGDDLYKVIYNTCGEGIVEKKEEHHQVIPEDDVTSLIVILCLQSVFLPTKESHR